MEMLVTGGSGFVGRTLIRRLIHEGHAVRAIGRTDQALAAVRAAGAEPRAAELDDVEALVRAMQGAEVVFHCAAFTGEWAPWETFERANVTGTKNVLTAARRAGVRRVVHVSTEAVLLDGGALVQVDETRPLPERTIGHYGRSKALAERAALEQSKDGLEVVIVRPRFVWGKGDTTLVPKLVDAVKSGRFKWIDGGRALTSTCHVENVCEGMLLAAMRGVPKEIYFLTDGEPIQVRQMLTRLLKTEGVTPGAGSIPLWIASAAAAVSEGVWNMLRIKSVPPATRTAVLLIGQEVTVVDQKARRELGYAPRLTIDEGFAQLSAPRGG